MVAVCLHLDSNNRIKAVYLDALITVARSIQVDHHVSVHLWVWVHHFGSIIPHERGVQQCDLFNLQGQAENSPASTLLPSHECGLLRHLLPLLQEDTMNAAVSGTRPLVSKFLALAEGHISYFQGVCMHKVTYIQLVSVTSRLLLKLRPMTSWENVGKLSVV